MIARISSVPRATLKPTPKAVVWAAGFIEGEGSFTRYKNPSCKAKFLVRMSASQKEPQPLRRLQRFFGGSIKPKNSRKIWWEKQRRFIYSSNSWVWRIYGEEAKRVARLLYPYLSNRRKCQAREILDFSYTNPNPATNGPKRGCKLPRKN